MSIHSKYKTKAAEFYWLKLESMIKGNQCPSQPDYDEGRKVMNTGE